MNWAWKALEFAVAAGTAPAILIWMCRRDRAVRRDIERLRRVAEECAELRAAGKIT
jgi:hypothetical protein